MNKFNCSVIAFCLGGILGVLSMSYVSIKEINRTQEKTLQEEFSYSIKVFADNNAKEIFSIENVSLIYHIPDFILCKEQGKDGKPDILIGQPINKDQLVVISKIIRVEL
jgi:hypothetical protein